MDFNEKMKIVTRKWNFTNDLLPRIKDLLDETYPHDMLDYVSGRVSIGVTEVTFSQIGLIGIQSRTISEFSSKENCLDVILASCCIPGWAGYKRYEVNGRYFIDGGFTNNLPVIYPDETIRIQPFFTADPVEIMINEKYTFKSTVQGNVAEMSTSKFTT